MKKTIFAAIGLAVLSATGTSHAQIDYTDVKAGTMLDGKGIRLGAFIKLVPLPPGNWLVVARKSAKIPLTGGNGTYTATSQITFTLKSADASNPIFALIVSFTPDSIPVNWNANYCESTNSAFSLTFGSGKYGTANACAAGQWKGNSLRSFLVSAPTHPTEQVRELYGALMPYAVQAPEAYSFIQINARRDRGRTLDYAVFARIPADFKPGTDFDTQIREWVKNSAQSVMDMLDNTATPMPEFPVAAASVRPQQAISNTPTLDSGPKGVDLRTLQVGMNASEAMRIPNYNTALPLPPGSWIVAGRHDEGIDTQNAITTLTLRNSDITAGLAALVVAIHSNQFSTSTIADGCQGTARGHFQMVEDLGTNANSEVKLCAAGGVYSASLKQMVRDAPRGKSQWFKENLTPLGPYIADLPDSHIWLRFDSGRDESMRVQWAFYSRVPVGMKPENLVDAPLREWIRTTGQSMVSFHSNHYSAIAPFPAINAKP